VCALPVLSASLCQPRLANKFNTETDALEGIWKEFSDMSKKADTSELDNQQVENLILRGREAVTKHQKNHKVAMALIKANEPKPAKKPRQRGAQDAARCALHCSVIARARLVHVCVASVGFYVLLFEAVR